MLKNDAMIVRLSVSQWTARKFDRKVTAKVAEDYGASSDAGRYNKVLIAKGALKEITQAISRMRNYHYVHTLPWDDSGARLLTAALFMTYSETMRKFKSDFEVAVNSFVELYPTYREEACFRLGALFNKADYPDVSEIRGKYGAGVEIEPIPTGADFRVDIQAKEMKRLQNDIQNRANLRMKEATDSLYRRLADVTSKFADTLREDSAIFRNSLVNNIVELVELLPKLNVSKDPKLEKLRKEIEKKIAATSPDVLRENTAARKTAVKTADSILEQLEGYV